MALRTHNWIVMVLIFLVAIPFAQAERLSYSPAELNQLCMRYSEAKRDPKFEAYVIRPIMEDDLPLWAVRALLIGGSGAVIGTLTRSLILEIGRAGSKNIGEGILNLSFLIEKELLNATTKTQLLTKASYRTAMMMIAERIRSLAFQTGASVTQDSLGSISLTLVKMAHRLPELSGVIKNLLGAIHVTMIRGGMIEGAGLTLTQANKAFFLAKAAQASGQVARGVSPFHFVKGLLRPPTFGGGPVVGAGFLLLFNPTPMGDATLSGWFASHPENFFSRVSAEMGCDMMAKDSSYRGAAAVQSMLDAWDRQKAYEAEDENIPESVRRRTVRRNHKGGRRD